MYSFFFPHRTPPIMSLGTCISAYIPFLNRWWANWDKPDTQFLPLIFFFLTFSLYFFSLFLVFSVYHRSWTILARTQSTNILQPQKWASFCYQKQLLAFCSWLCCLVLALLLQVHLITIFFSFFFLVYVLKSWNFDWLCGFLFEGLFSFR